MPAFKHIAQKVKQANLLHEHHAEGEDGVKVTVRVRPFIKEEFSRGVGSEPKLCVDMPTKNEMEITDEIGKKHHFTFDRVYWSHTADHPLYATQDTLYNELGISMLEHALRGFNTCIFAYGQTGSGKSYSVLGSNSQDGRGLLPRIVEGVFGKFNQSEDHKNSCMVSFLEIYNENIFDLLAPSVDEDEKKKDLKVRLHPILGAQVVGLETFQVFSLAEVMNLVETGMRKRAVGATAMNFNSSRSHCIFTMRTSCEDDDGVAKMSQTHLVDLAGSERAGRTGAQGARLKEGAAINQSLSTLARVISTLAENSSGKSKKNPPFRDSKLTYILKESLCGNSKTYMMAAISPSLLDFEETMSTLRFAHSAKKVQLAPVANEVHAGSERAIELQLRAELANLKEKLAACKIVRAVDLIRFKDRQRILNQQRQLCDQLARNEDDDQPRVVSSGLDDLIDSSGDEEESLVGGARSMCTDVDTEDLKAELSEANQRLKQMEHATHAMKDFQEVKQLLQEEEQEHEAQKSEHADLRAELEAARLQEHENVDKLQCELTVNNSERIQLQTNLQTKTSELDVVMADLKDAQEQLECREGKLYELTSEISSLQIANAKSAAKRVSRTKALELEMSAETEQKDETRAELKDLQCELADTVANKIKTVTDELHNQTDQMDHNSAMWAAREKELESEIASQRHKEVLLQEDLQNKNTQLDATTVELKRVGAQFDATTTELNCLHDELERNSQEHRQDVAAWDARLREELRMKNAEVDATTAELKNVQTRFDVVATELICLNDESERISHEHQEDMAARDARLQEELRKKNTELDATTTELNNVRAQWDAAIVKIDCANEERERISHEHLQDAAASRTHLQDELRMKSTELDATTAELKNIHARFDATTTELNCLNDEAERTAHEHQQDAAAWSMRERQLESDISYLLGQQEANKEGIQELQKTHTEFRNLTALDLKDQLAASLQREEVLTERLGAIAVSHEKELSSISRSEANTVAILEGKCKVADRDLGVHRCELQQLMSEVNQERSKGLFSNLFCGSRCGSR